MQAYEVQRATQAAMSSAASLGLTSHDATILHNSNKLTLRLQPCDVLARVGPAAHQSAQREVDITGYPRHRRSWPTTTGRRS
ncbi:hypothetical protein ACFY36_01810 [Actinoplanes sp. NPDC000266]